jgi:hypothetical protein
VSTYWATIGKDIIGHHDRLGGVGSLDNQQRGAKGMRGNKEINPRGKGRRTASAATTMTAQ